MFPLMVLSSVFFVAPRVNKVILNARKPARVAFGKLAGGKAPPRTLQFKG